MTINKEDRYQVVRPGGGGEVGMCIGTCKYIEEARKLRDEDWNNHTFIWDKQKVGSSQTGGVVE